ncbi:MAG: patatin-like phospholipase family protein [Asticcacaulis sp.]
MKFAVIITGLMIGLSACTTLERPDVNYPAFSDLSLKGFENVRMLSNDSSLKAELEADLRKEFKQNREPLHILALSGGGADGAFGAGVLLGWTKRGDRPEFRVVTGVSTGALIAPFAFLGPDYDEKLKEAYISGVADNLRKSRGVMSIFTPGVLSANNLQALVDTYVDEEMVTAIAREHSRGRSLLVATTNLDSQSGIVWDIGAIAKSAVDAKSPEAMTKGRDLIRKVLVASASVPGAFAPVMIDVERQTPHGKELFSEMHVDGGVTMPFFVLPEALLNWDVPRDLFSGGHIYVLINGKISPQPAVTPYNAINIMTRSLDTLTKAQARSNLIAVEGFAMRNGMELGLVSLPDEFAEGGMLAFEADSMRRVFYYGFQLGASDKLWAPAEPSQ